MAHTCPTCGQWCYCNGDVDDCCNDFDDDVEACMHCYEPDCPVHAVGDCDGCDDDEPICGREAP